MRFTPAVCAAFVFLFIGSVLTLAGETAFRPYGILGAPPTSEQLASTKRLHAVLMDGWKLTPEKAAQLETKLAQNPENVAVRLLLISYYLDPAHSGLGWASRSLVDAGLMQFLELRDVLTNG